MSLSVQFDESTNVALLGGKSLVFHCHYYNCALQEAIEQGLGEQAKALQIGAARDAVAPQLVELLEGTDDTTERLEKAGRVFAMLGFGALDFGELKADGGVVRCPHSHYAMGWLATRGERSTPACDFVSGFVAAVASAAFRLAPENVTVEETECLACGGAGCTFTVAVR